MKRKIYVMLIAIGIITIFGAAPALADSSDVTTTWVVPADTTIAISYPTGQGKIEFNAAGQNFTDLGATSQGGATAGLRITNQGNTALEINGSWTATWPTGVEFVNISVTDDTNATYLTFGSTNETVNQTFKASLAISGSEDYWFWTTGTEVAETAGVDRTLRIYSSKV